MASASMLGSLEYFFEIERVIRSVDVCNSYGVFDAITQSFLENNVTIRKRSAYLMQLFSQRAHESLAKEVREKGSHLSPQCNSFSGKKFWFDDFLSIYNQLEGCHAMHLVQQIWPLFDHLYGLCNNITGEEERAIGSIPPMTMGLLKAVVELFLRAPLLQIRKAVVHRLLSFHITTRATSKPLLHYLFFDFMLQLDTASYFHSSLRNGRKDVGCAQGRSDAEEQHKGAKNNSGRRTVFGDLSGDSKSGSGSSSISVTKYPGVLFPYFISRLLAAAAMLDGGGADITSLIVKGVVNAFVASSNSCSSGGGFTSMTALSWVIRSIGDTVNYSSPQLQNALGVAEIAIIERFMQFRHRELTNITRENLIDSLMPAIISCSDIGGIGVLRFISLLDSFFTIERVMMDEGCLQLLVGRLIGYFSSDYSVCDTVSCTVDEYEFVPTVHSLLHRRLPQQYLQLFEEKCRLKEVISDASSLFKNAYLTSDRQLCAVKLLRGVARLACVICKGGAVTTLIDGSSPLLQAAQSISSNVSSYLLISLQSSYANTLPLMLAMRSFLSTGSGVSSSVNSDVTCSSGAHKVTLANSLHLTDLFTQMLGHLLVLQKVTGSYGSTSNCCVINSAISLVTYYETVIHSGSGGGAGPAHELQKFLAVRGLARLLGALKGGLWPLDKFDFHALSKLTSPLRRICASLVGRCELNLDNLKIILDADCSSSSSSNLYMDTLLSIGKIPSSYSSLFYESKWDSLQHMLDMLVMFEKQFSGCINDGDALSATSLSIQLLHHADSSIEHATDSCYISLFDACTIAIRRYFYARGDGDNNALVIEGIHNALEKFWEAAIGGTHVKPRNIIGFVNMAFDRAMVENLDICAVMNTFKKVYDSSHASRPHILQYLLQKLFSVFTAHPLLSLAFFDNGFILELIMYKEPKFLENDASPDLIKSSDYTDSDNEPGGSGSGSGLGLELRKKVCRLIVLVFLESLEFDAASGAIASDALRRRVSELTIRLLKINLKPEFENVAIVSSEYFGKKLRCWQGLCVLSRYVTRDMLEPILPYYFTTLNHFCHPAIRGPQEMFGASLCVRFTDAVAPIVTARLRGFNHPQQQLISYFVILAYYTEYIVDGKVLATAEALADVMNSITPWVACALGLPRCIAQMILSSLTPLYLQTCCPDRRNPSPFESMAEAIRTNKETAKVISRQRIAFKEVPLEVKMSVRGLRSIKADNLGEIVPEHLIDTIMDIIKSSTANEETDGVGNDGTDVTKSGDIAKAINGRLDPGPVGVGEINSLQTKIIPFDELNIALEDETLSRNRNEIGRQRQPLIVCASLVDKVANLAGISRTCEIFAVEKMLVSSLQACKCDEFKSISVNAENWVRMEQVPSTDLAHYLQSVKERGYVIVGLEQTDASLLLDSTEATAFLPAKCLLLLGREKEGIPVELLRFVDICLEIPQYGIIRSLNVHVSCAIAVWEITRRNKILKAFK